MAKLVDARDLKSLGPCPHGFDPRRPHHSLQKQALIVIREGVSPRAPPVLRSWLLLEPFAFSLLQLLALSRLGFLLGLEPNNNFRDGHAGPPHTFLLKKAYDWTSIRFLLASP